MTVYEFQLLTVMIYFIGNLNLLAVLFDKKSSLIRRF